VELLIQLPTTLPHRLQKFEENKHYTFFPEVLNASVFYFIGGLLFDSGEYDNLKSE
jgi:hypothetical protein